LKRIKKVAERRNPMQRSLAVIVLQSMVWAASTALLILVISGAPAEAQEKSEKDLEVIQQKIRTDKKVLVSYGLALTESEAAVFWPVYEVYQNGLRQLTDRYIALIDHYVQNRSALGDQQALKIVDDFLAIERDHVNLMQTFLPEFKKVLPAVKLARYYQLENKIHAIVKFEMAEKIPLVE
jgi:hypothetical protein